MATMQDVARLARVDTSTVSLALRDDARITAATKARVRAAAIRLGYKVNPLVAAWIAARRASRKTPAHVALAYLSMHPVGTRWGAHVHYRTIFEGARERAMEFGYSLTEFRLADYANRMGALDRVLHARGVRGLIIGPTRLEQRLVGLTWDRLALVAVGYALADPVLHRVTEDHHCGLKLAFEACLRKKYKRIGLAITGRHNQSRLERWVGAFMAELILRVPDPRNRVAPFIGDLDAGRGWARQKKIDVVLADEPEKWLHQGVEVFGFAISEPEIGHGVHENNHGIGRCATELLIGLVQRNERGIPKTIRQTLLVEPRLLE
jgi:DNA-binding LacI/PurR family transcriptional regulator